MPAFVIVHIDVQDYNAWKEAFDNGHNLRKSHGEVSHQLLQSYGTPSDIVAIFHWDTLENATSYFEHEALMNSLIVKGVSDKPNISYYDEVEMIRKHYVRSEKFDG